MTMIARVFAVATAAVLAACSGGGAHGNGSDTTPRNGDEPDGETTELQPIQGQVVEADSGPQVQVINEPGQLVDIYEHMPAGKVTIVDFYADWCGACKIAEKKITEAIAQEPRIVVRKVNIEDDTSEVATHYDVGTLPHIRVYDTSKKLVYALTGNDAMTAHERALELLEP